MNIIEIESKENKKIKELNKLKLRKYREREGKFFVENWKIIRDAFFSGIYFRELFLTNKFLDKNKYKLESLAMKGEKIFLINESIAKNISTLNTPQGMVAVYDKVSKNLDWGKDIIYLNGISDPGNLGTILRSAVAFGLVNIVLDEECVDLYNPKTIQASKDAIFKLNIVFEKKGKILQEIKKNNFDIYATNVEKGKSPREVFKIKDKKCIILGSESYGVKNILGKEAIGYLNIKTTSEIESLNVAVSAGIIFYELACLD
jgi:TrmH family RNA methyltransferase